jgi:RNA polymerase sigma-70 factor (ECF subfamily)
VPTRLEQFESLVASHSRVVASAIRRVCSRQYRTLIPDVEQEVYEALWKRLGSGKEIEHPSSYLYKVALTTALAVVRKHAPETRPIDTLHEPLPEATNTFGGLLPAERARLLGEVLALLPIDQSRAVRAHLAGFSHSEVAALYGWTASVARHRIYRGIEALREKLKGASIDVRAAARS